MPPDRDRPLIVLLASHWLSMFGVALATTAGFLWVLVLPQHLRGRADSPYIGILAFLVIPAILLVGLVLIPIGIVLARRRVSSVLGSIADHAIAWRKIGLFVGLITAVNLVIGSQASYRAVRQLESEQFCGQTCHVMKPEFTAWKHAPHPKVECVECHVAPGASGWLAAKTAGTRQLMDVAFHRVSMPIASATQSNKLIDSEETCERCHARNRELGSVVKVFTSYADDEHNTRSQTVLVLPVGNGAKGIHGAHFGPGVEITYSVADAARQQIRMVEYSNGQGVRRTYMVKGTTASAVAELPRHRMQCADCHNRPAHTFEAAGDAVDKALEDGSIGKEIPWIRRNAVVVLTASNSSTQVPQRLRGLYPGGAPTGLDAAANELQRIFERNVFPDLKVTWGTYPRNMGHPRVTGAIAGDNSGSGCFRCHDDNHFREDGRALSQDCGTCHRVVAMDEKAPEVLKTLGINQ